MSKPLYESLEQLQQAIVKYLKEEQRPTPRHFRAIGLGINKQNLSTWKKTKPEYFYLIKNAEDLILAQMEQMFSYGGKEMYNLKLTMKAYDKLYREEVYAIQEAIEHKEQTVDKEQKINFILPASTAKKGIQSDRKPKLISEVKQLPRTRTNKPSSKKVHQKANKQATQTKQLPRSNKKVKGNSPNKRSNNRR